MVSACGKDCNPGTVFSMTGQYPSNKVNFEMYIRKYQSWQKIQGFIDQRINDKIFEGVDLKGETWKFKESSFKLGYCKFTVFCQHMLFCRSYWFDNISVTIYWFTFIYI